MIDNQRHADLLSMTPPRGDRSWCTSGSFLRVSPEPTVICPLCFETFPQAHMKATHLQLAHLAKVREHVDQEANDVYEWRLT